MTGSPIMPETPPAGVHPPRDTLDVAELLALVELLDRFHATAAERDLPAIEATARAVNRRLFGTGGVEP